MFDASRGDQCHLSAPVIGKMHFQFFKIHRDDVPNHTTRKPIVADVSVRKLLKTLDLRRE